VRQPLHAEVQTTAYRVIFPGLIDTCIGVWIIVFVRHPFVRAVLPEILICGGAIGYAVATTVFYRRFKRVWLDDDTIETDDARIPLTDMWMAELVSSRPNYIRLRFKGRPPILFFPTDASFFGGGGEHTRDQLKRLISDTQRPAS
jgi:hypothetical protein